MHRPLALRLCRSALAANYRNLCNRSGVDTGAAIKANAYGLGVEAVARTLLAQGCRSFFVSSWSEAASLEFLEAGMLSVLHGFGPDDEPRSGVRPVLVSSAQVARWKASPWGREPCDVMIDTGMNRLGLAPEEASCLDGLTIDTLHSHLACADEDHPLNRLQLNRFREARATIKAGRYSLANSAAIYLGRDYAFDLVRPGLAPGKTPLEVEQKLEKVTPGEYRQHAHHWLILHGRYICKARSPECWRCPIVELCRYRDKRLIAPKSKNAESADLAR